MVIDLLLVAAGVALLYFGGEALVNGAVALSTLLGLSPLVIGLTVVSFGTSSPELASTLAATFRGSSEVAFGNVVGSNIANLLLILGLTALVRPLETTARFLKREVPFMVAASLLVLLLVQDNQVSRFEGLLLTLLLGVFLIFLFLSESEKPAVEEEFKEAYGEEKSSVGKNVVLVIAGIVMLTLGARALIAGGVSLAHALGISERIIGLTMVALGTSIPELACSVVAALKRESGIVLGNIIGSNVFNILCVLGFTVLVRPLPVDTLAARPDLFVMVASAALVWPLLATRLRLERWEGGALLAAYVAYMAYLFI